jgi:hypothetical protein
MVSPQSAQIASSLPVTGMTTQQLENIQKTARKGSLGKMRFNQEFFSGMCVWNQINWRDRNGIPYHGTRH